MTVVKRFLDEHKSEQQSHQDNDISPIEIQLCGVLPSANFVRVPSFYRNDPATAWLPAMVNLLNAGTLIIPEPFVSQTDSNFNNKFKTLSGTYLDDWYFYHTGDGEIHCGTNAKRDPGSFKTWWLN
jgi:protein-arginine deiminase